MAAGRWRLVGVGWVGWAAERVHGSWLASAETSERAEKTRGERREKREEEEEAGSVVAQESVSRSRLANKSRLARAGRP